MIGYDEIAEASRYLDAEAEEGHDFGDMLRRRGITPDGLVKAAEQRALRVAAIADGQDPRTFPRNRPSRINLPAHLRRLLPSLQLAYIDGFIAGRVTCDPDDRIQRFPQPED